MPRSASFTQHAAEGRRVFTTPGEPAAMCSAIVTELSLPPVQGLTSTAVVDGRHDPAA